MPKSQSSQVEDPEDEFEPEPSAWHRAPWWLRVVGLVFVLAVLLVGSFELVYAGKIYPGVSADGVYLGGLSQADAVAKLKERINAFSGQVVTISNGSTNLRIPVASLAPSYNPDKAAKEAFEYARKSDWTTKINQQLHALEGRPTIFTTFSYDDSRLVPYLSDFDDDITSSVSDASLSFDASQPQVTPGQAGKRLDLGQLMLMVADTLSQTSTDPITAPVYSLAPQTTTDELSAVTDELGGYLDGPITLEFLGNQSTIDQKTIISWIQVGSVSGKSFLTSHDLADLYPAPSAAKVTLSKAAIQKYVAGLAANIDQTAQNAVLSMQNNQLAVVQPSRTGVRLDQADAVTAISSSLTKAAGERDISLKLDTTQADVNEDNLDSLGIKELISEGETYFPGSPSTRLTNVRAGAKRFNGVLLKPGEEFSFGKYLGDVGPETGYVPELVIIGDHEEYQYGGGLCQVSSTAFRAALQAGLPITERVNHAFAISYYTWPYSVPGVDATIYYPQVDFKFVNDTGHYILMQTTMSGTDLKFDFFGTKTKSGVIHGPEFITGSNDATQPSHTVFYRDVLDLSGAVTKTDTFNTYYQSSKNFPVTKQFN
ncbi:MAG TPA: VanW family protein [Candidatus Saccharimonadia bacterium]|nr:VanW family protein [Candidatus Saccharimonadia bacterium]